MLSKAKFTLNLVSSAQEEFLKPVPGVQTVVSVHISLRDLDAWNRLYIGVLRYILTEGTLN